MFLKDNESNALVRLLYTPSSTDPSSGKFSFESKRLFVISRTHQLRKKRVYPDAVSGDLCSA